MELIDQVSELLYKHNCVIIPGFGGFVANFKSARFQEDRLLSSPAIKRVAFNQSLVENDGLLIRHLSSIKGISYEEAEKEVAVFVRYLHDRLLAYRNYEFRNIGSLYLNTDDKIVFVPYEGLNFFPKSYGLEDVKVKRLQRVIDTQRIKEQHLREPEIKETETTVKPMFPWKAAAVAVVLIGAFAFLMWQYGTTDQNPVSEQSSQPLKGTEQTASFLGDSERHTIPSSPEQQPNSEMTSTSTDVAGDTSDLSELLAETKSEPETINHQADYEENIPSNSGEAEIEPLNTDTEELAASETTSGLMLDELRAKRASLFKKEITYHIVVARGTDAQVLEQIARKFRSRSFQPYLIDGMQVNEKLLCVEKFRNEEHARKYLQLVQKHENKQAEIVKINGSGSY